MPGPTATVTPTAIPGGRLLKGALPPAAPIHSPEPSPVRGVADRPAHVASALAGLDQLALVSELVSSGKQPMALSGPVSVAPSAAVGTEGGSQAAPATSSSLLHLVNPAVLPTVVAPASATATAGLSFPTPMASPLPLATFAMHPLAVASGGSFGSCATTLVQTLQTPTATPVPSATSASATTPLVSSPNNATTAPDASPPDLGRSQMLYALNAGAAPPFAADAALLGGLANLGGTLATDGNGNVFRIVPQYVGSVGSVAASQTGRPQRAQALMWQPEPARHVKPLQLVPMLLPGPALAPEAARYVANGLADGSDGQAAPPPLLVANGASVAPLFRTASPPSSLLGGSVLVERTCDTVPATPVMGAAAVHSAVHRLHATAPSSPARLGDVSALFPSPSNSVSSLASSHLGNSLAGSLVASVQSVASSAGGAVDSARPRARRRRATPAQVCVLNAVFERTCFPSTRVRADLAARLHMSVRAVQVWFQNKRQSFRHKNSGEAMPADSRLEVDVAQIVDQLNLSDDLALSAPSAAGGPLLD